MKLAIGIFGIHYIEELYFWMGGRAKTNYKDSVENNISFFTNYKILDVDEKNDLTFFSSTYFSSKLSELIDDYNFKSMKLSQINNNPNTYDWVKNLKQKNKRLKEVIKLILDDIEYDFVILTRFDILLKQKIYEYKLDLDKVNVLYDGEWEGRTMIDDNFYVLSYNKLKEFYEQLQTIDDEISSHYYHHYIGLDKFNILTKDIVIVHHDETRDILYNITRKRF